MAFSTQPATRLIPGALDAQFREDQLRRAKSSKTALKQVQSDKGGKPQPIAAVIKRAGWGAQGQRKQDEGAGHNANDSFTIHKNTYSSKS